MWLIPTVIAVICLVGALVLAWQNNNDGAQERVSIAVIKTQSSALLYLAHRLGFFENQGLNVELVQVGSGREALRLLADQRVDYAVSYSTPVIQAHFNGLPFKILTELHSSNRNTVMIFNKSRRIKTEADLLGKTIGVVPGTHIEYVLDLFLSIYNIPRNNVNVVEGSAESTRHALEAGEVDAALIWQPHTSRILKEFPDKFGVFEFPTYAVLSTVVTTSERVISFSEINQKIVAGLHLAQEYFRANRTKAQDIVDSLVGINSELDTRLLWRDLDIHLGLSSLLATMLDEEMEWKLRSLQGTDITMAAMSSIRGNAYDLIEPTPLTKVIPELVTYR